MKGKKHNQSLRQNNDDDDVIANGNDDFLFPSKKAVEGKMPNFASLFFLSLVLCSFGTWHAYAVDVTSADNSLICSENLLCSLWMRQSTFSMTSTFPTLVSPFLWVSSLKQDAYHTVVCSLEMAIPSKG